MLRRRGRAAPSHFALVPFSPGFADRALVLPRRAIRRRRMQRVIGGSGPHGVTVRVFDTVEEATRWLTSLP